MRKEREGKVMRLVAICKALVSEGYVARKEKGKNARAIFLAYLTPTLHKLISLSQSLHFSIAYFPFPPLGRLPYIPYPLQFLWESRVMS